MLTSTCRTIRCHSQEDHNIRLQSIQEFMYICFIKSPCSFGAAWIKRTVCVHALCPLCTVQWSLCHCAHKCVHNDTLLRGTKQSFVTYLPVPAVQLNGRHGVVSYAVCNMQFTVCSMQYVVCNMQHAVYSMQCVVCSMHYDVRNTHYAICNMQYAVCSKQYAVCSIQYAVCSVQYAVCTMKYAIRGMHYEICNMQYAVSNMQYAVYSMQYAACSMQYALWSMQYAVCSMQYELCNMQYAVCTDPSSKMFLVCYCRTEWLVDGSYTRWQ